MLNDEPNDESYRLKRSPKGPTRQENLIFSTKSILSVKAKKSVKKSLKAIPNKSRKKARRF